MGGDLNQELPYKNHPITVFHNTIRRFNVAVVGASHYDVLNSTHDMSDNGDFDRSCAEISYVCLNLMTSDELQSFIRSSAI